jgi:hypothetical protein
MYRRLLAMLFAFAALALVAGGCGSDKKKDSTTDSGGKTKVSAADYKTKVTAIAGDFASAGQAFKDAVSPNSTPQQAATALEGFQKRVEKDVADLNALTPPDKAADAHKRLAAALDGIAKACQPSIDAGKAGDRAKLRTALLELQKQLNGQLGTDARKAATDIDTALASS